ncbi:MAG: hypothetical protein IID45_03065 [Planctomycetes bacterium]|nr:hypothetical protein [Planctomycetota bacterium]
MNPNRREFLQDVGSGMLIAGLGATLAGDLGISAAFAADGPGALTFGKLQPLVGMMQEIPAEKLQPLLVKKLKAGEAGLREMIAAAALANAQTFGGQDYVGFHTEMALLPALQMTNDLPKKRQPLPVLKVLYRNAQRIQGIGGAKHKTLKPIRPGVLPKGVNGGKLLRDATRAADMQKAERIFAAQAKDNVKDAYNSLLWAVEDDANVHRFVLAYRAWGLLSVVGNEHAHTMLRQCVRFCVNAEQQRNRRYKGKPPAHPLRRLIPQLVDRYKLLGQKIGTRMPEDAWIDKASQFIHKNDGEKSADFVAAALADGISADAIGHALSLAANLLVLRQDRFYKNQWRAHGATPGVHAADAVNAWRGMVRVSDHRNRVVGLLVSAYHTGRSKSSSEVAPYPLESHRKQVKAADPKGLLREAESAICKNEQGRAAAAIQIYGEKKFPVRPVFDLMLKYGISEDGRLHAEKYYRTVREEFAVTPQAFRWRHLTALARVTASAYGYNVNDKPGYRAPGYEQACRLLGVKG